MCPDPALVDQLDEEKLAQLSMVWWHLAAAAEMTVAPVELLLPRLDDESILRRALDEQDAGLLFPVSGPWIRATWVIASGVGSMSGIGATSSIFDGDLPRLASLAETSGEPLWS